MTAEGDDLKKKGVHGESVARTEDQGPTDRTDLKDLKGRKDGEGRIDRTGRRDGKDSNRAMNRRPRSRSFMNRQKPLRLLHLHRKVVRQAERKLGPCLVENGCARPT